LQIRSSRSSRPWRAVRRRARRSRTWSLSEASTEGTPSLRGCERRSRGLNGLTGQDEIGSEGVITGSAGRPRRAGHLSQ
jgi:hypothetical protein